AGRVAAAIAMLRASAEARRVLRTFDPQVVISVGGYASVPAVVAAVLARIPVALVEPNAIPGRANRLAARFAKRIFVQFEQSARIFGRSLDPARILATGIPLRTSLLESFADAPPRSQASSPLSVLVFGGSQGAYAAAGLDARVVAFEPEMPRRYREADVAVCRSGALTVAELALAALPALLIPYPYAADDHQTANAAALTESGAARLLDPATLSGALLVEELESLRRSPSRLHEMSGRAAKLAHPDAAERIVQECAALVGPGGRD
ncbi:MAG: glycosyltransferase, partial [Deltaproteobacteria bacterium]|nr:glycosyltransferase [Deltaproteobacteria bacterium]